MRQQQQQQQHKDTMRRRPAGLAAASPQQRSGSATLLLSPPRKQQKHKQKQFRPLLLLLLAVVACGCGSAIVYKAAPSLLPGNGGGFRPSADPADAALWRWLEAGGARLAFAPGFSRAAGVRGGFATRGVPAGGVVLSVPARMLFWFPKNWTNYAELGEHLAMAAANASGPHAPYFRTLPTLADPLHTLSWESFPPEQLHLLQAPALAARALAKQAALLRHWAARGGAMRAAGVTLEGLRAALVTISTRWYQGPTDGPYAGRMALIPAFDLLNHRNGCPVHYAFERCAPPLSKETCCVVRTRTAIQKGDEVCNAYGHLTPDMALIQYGFLLPEVEEAAAAAADGAEEAGGVSGSGGGKAGAPPLPPLSLVDAAGFEPADLWRERAAAPARTSGGRAALEAERARLAALLGDLRRDGPALEAAAAALVAGNSSSGAQTSSGGGGARGGAVAAMVLKWRRQRVAAIEAEIARLRAEVEKS